jgi:hypothetical protein
VKEVVMTPTSTPTPVHTPVRTPVRTVAPRRPPLAARRFGYLVAAIMDAVMLHAINRWPGWEEVPFLTSETDEVLLAVNASILVGMVVNVGYLAYDARWFRGLGDMVTTAVSFVAITVVWVVFPFAFDGDGVDWATVVRWLLGFGLLGTAVGFLAGMITLVRGLRER